MTSISKSIKFDNKKIADFFPTIRKRVDHYFKVNNISRFANGQMVFKTVFIFSIYLITYFLIISNVVVAWPIVLLILAGIHGLFTAFIGLNISHDAIHGAYSSNSKVNKIIGASMNLIGGSDYVWKVKHNIVHHTYTNIHEHDHDLELSALIRLNPEQKKWWIHQFQHIYVFLLYPLGTLTWVFVKDFINFSKQKFGYYDNSKHPKGELLRLIGFKSLYYTVFLIVPLLVISLPWYWILAGFIFVHFVEGLTLALVFQLAHLVEEAQFPEPDEEDKIHENWAAHQMYTTANFARKNPLVRFFCGGLNFQIEHHLFPKICHIHYNNIAPIVKETAEEFGLPYNEHETVSGALKSHVRLLKKLGRADEIQQDVVLAPGIN
jgi:linoleoyl-CoA desaturase